MHAQVGLHVRSCDTCARMKASFVPRDTTLHPLPIMGMFYRWSIDLDGPFPQSYQGNYYIIVMIERFSKWVEGAAIPSKGRVRRHGWFTTTYCASAGL